MLPIAGDSFLFLGLHPLPEDLNGGFITSTSMSVGQFAVRSNESRCTSSIRICPAAQPLLLPGENKPCHIDRDGRLVPNQPREWDQHRRTDEVIVDILSTVHPSRRQNKYNECAPRCPEVPRRFFCEGTCKRWRSEIDTRLVRNCARKNGGWGLETGER